MKANKWDEIKLAQTVCGLLLDRIPDQAVALPPGLDVGNLFRAENPVHSCYCHITNALLQLDSQGGQPEVGNAFEHTYTEIMDKIDQLTEEIAKQAFLCGLQAGACIKK